MKIGIVDADLIGRENHRFPNLACEKISGYWKDHGAEVILVTDPNYTWLFYSASLILQPETYDYDEIYVSKVFTDTLVPEGLLTAAEINDHIHIGGTGFYFDKAPNLPDDIEHHMPDYHLYDEWIQKEVDAAKRKAAAKGKAFDLSKFMVQFKEYTDYSIGFLTRGCFRQCKFCVNQKYNAVFPHSRLSEFYDDSRRKVCLLDDNFLGCAQWKTMLKELIATGRPFKFKQGLDERLLTEEKCEMLFASNYDADFTFAFDNFSDYDLIQKKLELIHKYRKNTSQNIKFYVLVGFESTDITDIEHAFARIELLFRYSCMPYIMRYQNKNEKPWDNSEFRGVYISLARWCNQPNFVKKKTFREFCLVNQELSKNQDRHCSTLRAMELIQKNYPEIADKYFDMRYGEGLLLEGKK